MTSKLTPSKLTPKQEDALAQFKKNVCDIIEPHHDDNYLLRWLRARGYDPKKSEDMFRKHTAFRQEWDADNIASWPVPEVIVKYNPGGHYGFDKEGFPVYYTPWGFSDVKGLSMSAKKNDLIRVNIQLAEYVRTIMKQQTEKLGKLIDKLILVVDLHDLTLKSLFAPGMDVILKIMEMFEGNYPESLKTCYIINAPKIWSIVWKVLKPVLNEDTRKKVAVYGTTGWKEKLHQIIDEDQIPKYWTGTGTDPSGDPTCKIGMGGKIPVSYYAKEQHDSTENLKKINIPSREKVDIVCNVGDQGCMLEYLFMTKARDIKYSVHYRDSDDKETVMVESQKVDSHRVPEDGVIECPHTGMYILRLDNTYSWTHSKKVMYRLEVIKNSEDEITITEAMDALEVTENGNL